MNFDPSIARNGEHDESDGLIVLESRLHACLNLQEDESCLILIGSCVTTNSCGLSPQRCCHF